MIANVIDTEWDEFDLLEIGITHISLDSREIVASFSLPIRRYERDPEVSPEIQKLTGWTKFKLCRQGFGFNKLNTLLLGKHGWSNRITIMDTDNEFPDPNDPFGKFLSPSRLNVSLLFSIKTGLHDNLGLDAMLAHYGLEFEGKRHFAKDDSYNIARLFLKVMYE